MWNAAIPFESVEVDLDDDEEAVLRVKNVVVFDGFTIPNALNSFHPAGHVNSVINSLKIKWSGTKNTKEWTDCADGFRGTYLEDSATIEVTATTPPVPARSCPPTAARNGFRFVSDRADTTVSHFAVIGRERNGVFF
jgi:hypothetical protein